MRVKPASIIMAALPGTSREVADRTTLGVATCSEWLTNLYKCGLVCISGWRRAGTGPYAAIYSDGPGQDAPSPPRMSEVNQRRSNKVGRAKKARQRANETITQCAIRTQPCSVFEIASKGDVIEPKRHDHGIKEPKCPRSQRLPYSSIRQAKAAL